MEDIRDEEVRDREEQDGSSAKQETDQNSSDRMADAQESKAAGQRDSQTTDDSGARSQKEQEAGTDEPMDPAKMEPAAEEPEKKGFFSKKKKEKDKRDQQIEELTDRVQRQMAEFDNFRKRSEKEKASMFEVGAKSVLEKILPTVDNFERGFANLDEEQKQDAFVQGMEKVYRQLLTSLEGIGVKPIEAVGQPFDPNFHNAVMHVEDEEAGENIVVEEFQKGYLYRDSVLRHSMVKVAN